MRGEGGGRKAESRKQKAESRKQKAESRMQNAECRMQNAECLVSFSELGESSVAHLAWTERSGVKKSEACSCFGQTLAQRVTWLEGPNAREARVSQ